MLKTIVSLAALLSLTACNHYGYTPRGLGITMAPPPFVPPVDTIVLRPTADHVAVVYAPGSPHFAPNLSDPNN